MHSRARTLAFLLPPGRFKNRLLRVLGVDLGPEARVGICLVLNVDYVSLDQESSIGHFNVFRDMKSLRLSRGARIGQWNWVSAARPLVNAHSGTPGVGELALGEESAITSRHYIDTSGGVSVGDFVTVAGVGSTFISHQIDLARNEQSVAGIKIGNFCLISSNCRFAPGAVVGPYSLLAMGAVAVGKDYEGGWLYGGTPIRPVKKLDTSEGYFARRRGPVNLPLIEK